MQSGNLLEDPFNTYDQTGSVPPFWTENPGDIDGYWVVTRYADMRAVLRDSESFSSVNASIPHMPMEHPMLPTETDPPTVNKYRGILLPCMTPDKIDPMEMRMREVSSGLIGSFQGRGWCDVVEDFARIYPCLLYTSRCV